MPLLLVCSSGGHLLDLVLLRAAFAGHRREWVTFDKADARTLLRGERVSFAHGPTNRSLKNLMRNGVAAIRTVRRIRPRVVVTTGAGVGVPFAWAARMRGATVIYVECTGRVDGLSLSARMIAPIAHALLVPWPEQAARHPRARYVGSNPLSMAGGDRLMRGPVPKVRQGVFVTVGTNEAPFDRMLRAVGTVHGHGPWTVQAGSSSVRRPGARSLAFMPFEAMLEEMSRARAIVAHAGVGSATLALASGLRPVLVPRRARYGEAVDDHQVAFARRLQEAGLAVVAESETEIAEALAGTHDRAPSCPGGAPLVKTLGRLLQETMPV